MGARQSNPGGGGGGAGGGCSATATASSSRVQNESGLGDSGPGNNAGFAGLLSSSLCQNGSMSNRSRPIASSSGNTSGSGVSDWRQRARSLTNVINTSSAHHSHNANSNSNGQPFVTVSPLGHSSFGLSASPDSLTSIDDLTFGRVFSAHSLPVQLVPFNGIVSTTN